ncbi:Uncharacterized protein FWK35_00006796 [Aphis craccivora]|uniref:Uncharacterized protein n=1 Tax=Aphis craccivora TaxID=307492 RepID=A0A6G0ZEX7_APHCR|nr:Uncharacterized protein FWK35_00006796 [Aphis craccivora]
MTAFSVARGQKHCFVFEQKQTGRLSFVAHSSPLISKGSPKTRVPDGSPTRSTGGDVNNNGPTKCLNGACGGYGPSSAGSGGGGAGDGPAAQPRRVQVTAKILFGSQQRRQTCSNAPPPSAATAADLGPTTEAAPQRPATRFPAAGRA